MSILRARAKCASTTSLLASIILLSACGGQPAPAGNNSAALDDTVENASIVMENVAAINAVAPVANEAKPVTAAVAAAVAPVAVAAAKPAAAPAAAPAATASAGDAANGAKLFAQCRVCHSVESGKNGLGPSLHGVVGRKAAVEAGFNYSTAMKNSGLTWTDAALNDYLRSPMKAVPGTKMAFAGITDDTRRADLIAYLDTLK